MAVKKIDVKCPVLEKGVHYLESPFGKREFPKGVITQHNGDDLIGKDKGTDWEIAIDDGVVCEVAYSETRGYYVGIKMKNGYITRYLHTAKGTTQVKKGQIVKKGQRIAFMGNSGYYKDAQGKKHRVGTHLHFAVVNNQGKFIDPMPYLMGEKDFNGGWEKGTYQVLYDKYLRTSPKVATNNKVVWKSLIPEWKEITYADKVGKARFRTYLVQDKKKVPITIELIDFAVDSSGNVWGRCKTKETPIFLCVQDKKGKQVKKV